MTIRNAYTEWSTSYDSDRNMTRDLDHRVMRETFSQRRFTSILETGCGTGKNTSLLVQLAQRVLALDFSEGMIAQAKAKIHSNNVQFTIADLTRHWPCADHSVDLVVCNLVLEHIADLDFIFAQANRVLTAGGEFFICELHPFRQYEGKKATFAGKDGQVEIAAYVHHLSDFLNAGQAAGFTLNHLGEWWHDEDKSPDAPTPPRLVSFLFEKSRN
jgi:ubiquinone/menaquinone biosynthesis C-methylase UbiE